MKISKNISIKYVEGNFSNKQISGLYEKLFLSSNYI